MKVPDTRSGADANSLKKHKLLINFYFYELS